MLRKCMGPVFHVPDGTTTRPPPAAAQESTRFWMVCIAFADKAAQTAAARENILPEFFISITVQSLRRAVEHIVKPAAFACALPDTQLKTETVGALGYANGGQAMPPPVRIGS